MPRQSVNEQFSVLFKEKNSKKKNNGVRNEKSFSILNGRLLDMTDYKIIDAKIKGSIGIDVDTGLITYFKLYSQREIDDINFGPHALKEEMTLRITKTTNQDEIVTDGQTTIGQSLKNEL